ncbi:MAG: PAC2 family protein [Candidatus Bathyarchaeia archaeon]|nr:PAC2 family protein [Candidatus Bathyarchaeota archaeon]
MSTEVFFERPMLREPVLVEGLPGIGFVANIVGLHLVKELRAKIFCEIHSPFFQAVALTTGKGYVRPPVNELYYAKTCTDIDLIILYGNTQASTGRGQYELSSKILDIAEMSGCRTIITVGGLKRNSQPSTPRVFCTATDKETLKKVMSLGASPFQGRVYGAAGLLLGLARLRGLIGYCILVETLGIYPDALAAKVALDFLSKSLSLPLDPSNLNRAVELTRRLLGIHGEESPKY